MRFKHLKQASEASDQALIEILVSVIIPVRTITPHLRETVKHLKEQSFKNFEIIVLTDGKEKLPGIKMIPSGEVGPAHKRNLGARKAKGEILAFLDDDSYPDKNWLKNAVAIFKTEVAQTPQAFQASERSERSSSRQSIAAVCGPCLTPPKDNIYQKASGWVWASWLGSGGAGAYRNRIAPRREVDDFPSVNLLVRKKDFEKVGGFDVDHWPGEDTKLCMDLVYKLKKKIIYDPSVIVYHHRRSVFRPHLKQISRYALRRGFFAKKFPKTSFRIGYLIPFLFAYGLIFGGLFSIVFPSFRPLYYILYTTYFILLLASGLEVLCKEKNFYLALLTTVAIFATHLWYGLLFPFGYFKSDLGVVLKKVDKKKKIYAEG